MWFVMLILRRLVPGNITNGISILHIETLDSSSNSIKLTELLFIIFIIVFCLCVCPRKYTEAQEYLDDIKKQGREDIRLKCGESENI